MSEATTGGKRLSNWLIGVAGSVVGGIIVYIFTQLPIGKPTLNLYSLYNLGSSYSIEAEQATLRRWIEEKTYVLKSSGWNASRDVEIVVSGETSTVKFDPDIYHTASINSDKTKTLSIKSIESGSEYFILVRDIRDNFETPKAEIISMNSSNAETKIGNERGGIEGSFFDFIWFFVLVYLWGIFSAFGLFISGSKTTKEAPLK